jgi:aspartyl-tRNA(Asn)/glutamyl-tRNA(Gln) amidotransferase subunit C
MKITEKDVLYVAALANLELTEQEIGQMAADMDSILGYIEQLGALDTSDVEPMAQVLYETQKESSTLRPDAERPCFTPEIAVANAPESGSGHFKVPKVIER